VFPERAPGEPRGRRHHGVARADPANVELDPRLGKARGERLVTKKFASAFHGTRLRLMLRAEHVDTVIVCGCTTSGCVRAAAVDGL
jgi:maleamate amidohydrolase